MEEKIKILEELQKYCSLRSIGLVMNIDDNDEWAKFVTAISDIIDGYRTLEKHIAFYEKHGSYKARIIELEDKNTELEEQVEYLKHEVELRDATVEKLVIEKMTAKAKVDNLLKELLKKLDEPCDDRWEKDNKDYYAKIKAQINIIKQLKEG